jgi:hypothetical protein
MYSLADMSAQLNVFRAKLAEATEHTNRAVELLDEARETIVAAFEQADPWLPPELASAHERLRENLAHLASADELISGYQARL